MKRYSSTPIFLPRSWFAPRQPGESLRTNMYAKTGIRSGKIGSAITGSPRSQRRAIPRERHLPATSNSSYTGRTQNCAISSSVYFGAIPSGMTRPSTSGRVRSSSSKRNPSAGAPLP